MFEDYLNRVFDEYGVAYIGLDDAYPGWYEMRDAILMFKNKIKVEGESESESESKSESEVLFTGSDSD